MKSTYKLEGLVEKNQISNILVPLLEVEGIQLVAFNSEESQLTLEYKDTLVDKIIIEVVNLIRKIIPEAWLKNE